MREGVAGPHRINQFLFLSYIVALANTYGYLNTVQTNGLSPRLFVLAVYLTYTLLYLSPAILLVWLLDRLLQVSSRFGWGAAARLWWGRRLMFAVAVLATTLIQVFIYADKTIYTLYGMHFNGFIWNLITTPGGIESLGGDDSASLTYALIVAGFLAVQVGLLAVVMWFPPLQWVWPRLFIRPVRVGMLVTLVVIGAGQQFAYGVAHMQSYSSVLVDAGAFPFYMPTTFNGPARQLGFDIRREETVTMKQGDIQLQYPLKPLVIDKPDKPLNVVWLVAESLRADMLDPQIMPATWEFSRQARRYTHHYSGGNGTRMGVFTMFYGLYGNYWFPFLNERRSALIMDVLRDQGYQLDLYTSSGFNYPEFDKTMFSGVPSERMHQYRDGQGWERDRINVTDILSFIGNRDKTRPFMTFMFFESPHARYYFPPESVIQTPYLEELNYATMDLENDIGLIKNRYINSCHHLDSQIGRVIDYLRENDLLDSTIVLITGDHGEEFMEKGRWGHNSEFTEEQTHTPFVLWVPGSAPAVVDDLSSHLDIPATLMPLLGVTNPPEDYSLGINLLSNQRRNYAVIADWARIAYVGPGYKASFPVSASQMLHNRVTDSDDQSIEDTAGFYAACKPDLLEILAGMSRFGK
ncbi:MAG: sulfatase-like hydrolase/transferase [Phycisphaerales bacterium]